MLAYTYREKASFSLIISLKWLAKLLFSKPLIECYVVVDHRTFIDDYLMTVEFIDWLKVFYLGKAKFLM